MKEQLIYSFKYFYYAAEKPSSLWVSPPYYRLSKVLYSYN